MDRQDGKTTFSPTLNKPVKIIFFGTHFILKKLCYYGDHLSCSSSFRRVIMKFKALVCAVFSYCQSHVEPVVPEAKPAAAAMIGSRVVSVSACHVLGPEHRVPYAVYKGSLFWHEGHLQLLYEGLARDGMKAVWQSFDGDSGAARASTVLDPVQQSSSGSSHSAYGVHGAFVATTDVNGVWIAYEFQKDSTAAQQVVVEWVPEAHVPSTRFILPTEDKGSVQRFWLFPDKKNNLVADVVVELALPPSPILAFDEPDGDMREFVWFHVDPVLEKVEQKGSYKDSNSGDVIGDVVPSPDGSHWFLLGQQGQDLFKKQLFPNLEEEREQVLFSSADILSNFMVSKGHVFWIRFDSKTTLSLLETFPWSPSADSPSSPAKVQKIGEGLDSPPLGLRVLNNGNVIQDQHKGEAYLSWYTVHNDTLTVSLLPMALTESGDALPASFLHGPLSLVPDVPAAQVLGITVQNTKGWMALRTSDKMDALHPETAVQLCRFQFLE